MPIILLYNIRPDKLQTIRFLTVKLGLKSRVVAPEEYLQPIGYLLGLEGFSPVENAAECSFSDEMLLLAGLSDIQTDQLLTGLRLNRTPVALKAVLTQTNAAWSSLSLHEELVREHEAMQNLRAKDAEKKTVHKKK